LVTTYGCEIAADILSNFVDGEKDLFYKIKMSMQLDIMFAIKQQGSLEQIGMIALSHLGWDFKEQFTRTIKDGNDEIYKMIFIDGEFCNFDIKHFLA